MPFFLLTLYALALGAIVGSFLNVVIFRFPAGESIVFPGSKCPRCQTPIKAYDNIPVLSWLILRGRCRACREPISALYPIIELANALFYVAIFLRTGVSWSFLPLAAIVSMTIVLIFIDLDIQILPDVVDLPGIAVGLVIGWMALGADSEMMLSASLRDSVLGAVLGGGLLWGIALVYRGIRGFEGMGLGDVKMLAMVGAVVGWEPIIPLLFLASIMGATVGIAFGALKRGGMQLALPFGVFLGIATLVVMFFGPTLLEWYGTILLR